MRVGAATFLALAVVAASDRPGELLTAGTRLVYESAGQETVWVVDSVQPGDDAACGRAWIRIGPRADERHDCIRDGALHRRDLRTGQWREERPVAPTTERRYARGVGTAVFETGELGTDTIGTRLVRTVETTMVMLDSTGTPVRRLRERYAVGLMTATWGRFEVPEAGGGWRVQQEFRLRAIE
ncbi:MAG: hypothetical protein ACYC2K_05920 [Gemmatimonadales bacterium]